MMIKLLILSVSLFVLASADDVEPDVDLNDGRPFGNYKPVPIDDPLLKAAIKAKKPQIVDKVSQFYANITENAGIKINLAESKIKLGYSNPPTYKYQANLTVLAFRTVPGPVIDYPVLAEIVTFNVTIIVYDYGGADTKFTNLQFVGFPGLEEDPKKEDDLPEGRKFSAYKQVPIGDIVLGRALNATKAELVQKVGKVYPLIDADTKIRVNLAEKKINLDNIFPPIYKYQANITLLIFSDIGLPPDSPPYQPVLTFNVTIVVWNYGGEDTTKYKNLTFIGLPGLEKEPSLESILADPRRQDPELGDRGLSAYQPLATNDSILKQAIKSVKAELVLKVVKLYPNATYSPKITINSAEKKIPMDYAFPAYYKYQANITLFAVESSNPAVLAHLDHALIFTQIVTFNVTIIGTTYGAESAAKYDKLRIVGLPGYVEPDQEPLFLNSSRYLPNQGRPWGPLQYLSVNDTGMLIALEAVQNYTWTELSKVTKFTQVPGSSVSKDFVINGGLFRAPKDEGYSKFDFEYTPLVQLGELYKPKYGPPYQFAVTILASFASGKISFSASKFKEVGGVPPKPAPVIPDLKGPAPHRDVTEDLKDAILNLKDAISDLKESTKPAAPADLQINDFLVKDLPEVVDDQDVKRLLESKLRPDIVSTANYLNHLEGNEVVAPSYAEIGYGPISQKTVQLPFKIRPPIFKRTYTVTGASVQLPIVPFTVFAKNLTLELSELRRNLSFSGPLNIYAEKLVRVNSYLLPDKKDDQPLERPFDLPKPLPSSSDDLL